MMGEVWGLIPAGWVSYDDAEQVVYVLEFCVFSRERAEKDYLWRSLVVF